MALSSSTENTTDTTTNPNNSSQSIQYDYESMSGNVSFKEFLHQYDELNKWLEQIQSFKKDEKLSKKSFCEIYTNQVNI